MNEKELLKLKKKVDTAEHEGQRLKGEKKAILANLKEDFDCADTDDAEETRKRLKKELKNLKIDIEKAANELEKKLKEISKEYEIPDEQD